MSSSDLPSRARPPASSPKPLPFLTAHPPHTHPPNAHSPFLRGPHQHPRALWTGALKGRSSAELNTEHTEGSTHPMTPRLFGSCWAGVPMRLRRCCCCGVECSSSPLSERRNGRGSGTGTPWQFSFMSKARRTITAEDWYDFSVLAHLRPGPRPRIAP
eukprot:888378-Rhodomonas_salina.1